MSLPFDATLKDMVQDFTPDFLAGFNQPVDLPATVLNVDLSTISAATDVAIGHGDPLTRITDFNFQSGPDPNLDRRALLYNTLFHHRLGVPVHTVLVLLRPAADQGNLTGRLRYEGQARRGRIDFRYEVIRLWERPVRTFLQGGLGTLPLTPLGRLPRGRPIEEALPGILRQIDERIRRETSPDAARRLMTATYVLTGLRMTREEANTLFREVLDMRESSTYMGIIEDGRLMGLREAVILEGTERFGPPPPSFVEVIEQITDAERLRRMIRQVLVVNSWQSLLESS